MCVMKVWFSFLCQLFHINQLSRLVSTALPWRILPVLDLSPLVVSIYMTEMTDFFKSISVQTEERNYRHLSLKKIGLKAEAFLGLFKEISMFTVQKQLWKTCLIASEVLNQSFSQTRLKKVTKRFLDPSHSVSGII